MKNLSAVLARASYISAAAIALGACSADDALRSPESTCNTVIEVMSVAPVADNETNSRTAIDPTVYTSGQIGINWLPSDKIGVFGDKGSLDVPFDNQTRTESDKASFGGTLKDGEKPLYAYYPYPAGEGSTLQTLKGSLALKQTYSTATRSLDGDWKVGTPVDGSSSRFSFENIFPLLKLDINAGTTQLLGDKLKSIALRIDGAQIGGDFAYDIATGSCSFTQGDGVDCVTVEFSDSPQLTASTFSAYMSVAPAEGIGGKSLEVTVTTDRHIATFSRTLIADRFTAGTYYTVPLMFDRFTDIWNVEDAPGEVEENAAWVPGLSSRLACANTVFAIPGKPFMHKIRVPQSTSQTDHAVVPVKTGISRVYNLPEGLTWNAERCLVEGTAPAAGEYVYSVEFTLDGQTYKEGIRLTVSNNLISPTPMMGWQSWNVLENAVSYDKVCQQADAIISKGFKDVGYIYVGVDDTWQASSSHTEGRNADGSPKYDATKFPGGMKAVADYLHSKGLRAGIYSDCGTITCEGMIGSYNYESVDGQTYTAWGFDMLKEDWFWKGHGDANGSLDPASNPIARELYSRMGSALGGKAMLYMCEWGLHMPWKWGSEIGAQCWRMSYDARDGWMGGNNASFMQTANTNSVNSDALGIGLKNTIDLMRNLWPYVGINRYNDADMLCVGIRGASGSAQDMVYKKNQDISDTRYQTNFAMWCMYSSPLLLTLDLTASINDHDFALLKNEELIAINQDPLCQGAEWVKTVNNMDYYMKDLANGDVAIAVVNLGDSQGNYTVTLSDFEALNAADSYKVRNLIEKADAGTLSASSPLSGSLAAHGTYIIRLTKI